MNWQGILLEDEYASTHNYRKYYVSHLVAQIMTEIPEIIPNFSKSQIVMILAYVKELNEKM